MKLALKQLDNLYDKYNKFCYIHPDPLEFVYNYKKNKDREITGLLSSALAYGKVKQILKSVSSVLKKMGESPYNYIVNNCEKTFLDDFEDFKHRFTTGEDLVKLILGIKSVLKECGSLENCFVHSLAFSHNNFIDAVTQFAGKLNIFCKDNRSYLIPSPKNGSPCKRLMLYLRWMIRKDDVDPGCWGKKIVSSMLVIPLDVHMFNISKEFGLTSRKTADLKTAIQITNNFRELITADPVKYDFVLTRFGIRDELTYKDIEKT